uniref:Transcription factor AP-2 C-terminal domain-containing protein n=1 Tax=Eptatretus burgeri TaxID=7764 RepID=A0A8C4QFN0_EPTBU
MTSALPGSGSGRRPFLGSRRSQGAATTRARWRRLPVGASASENTDCAATDGSVNVIICKRCWGTATVDGPGSDARCFCMKCGESKSPLPVKRFVSSVKEEVAQLSWYGPLPPLAAAGPSSAESWSESLIAGESMGSTVEGAVVEGETGDGKEQLSEPSGVCASVHSLLHISQGKPQRKYDVSWGEIQRRAVSPERLSPYCVNSYLRNSKTALAVVRAELVEKRIPINSRSGVVTSLTKLCEGEVKDLVEDMQFLIAQYVPRKLIVSAHCLGVQGDVVAVRATQLHNMIVMLEEYSYLILQRASRFSQVTHGLGPGMFRTFTKLLRTLAEEELEYLSTL